MPIVLSSRVSDSTPHWSTTNLPTGMTVKGKTATVQLTSEPFWTTNLTTSSTLSDLGSSLLEFSNGLDKLVLTYFNLPIGLILDTTKGTYGVVVDTQPSDDSYGATIYFSSLFSSAKGEARLVVKGVGLG